MTLNFGAIGELPIRHSSISSPKKLNSLEVAPFSQSSAARCSSVNRLETQMMLTASRPAAYVRSWPRWVWSVRSSWFSMRT